MKAQKHSMFSRQSTGDKAFDIINVILMCLVLIVILYPLWFVVIASVSDPLKVMSGEVLFWPQGVSLKAYNMVSVSYTHLGGRWRQSCDDCGNG